MTRVRGTDGAYAQSELKGLKITPLRASFEGIPYLINFLSLKEKPNDDDLEMMLLLEEN